MGSLSGRAPHGAGVVARWGKHGAGHRYQGEVAWHWVSTEGEVALVGKETRRTTSMWPTVYGDEQLWIGNGFG